MRKRKILIINPYYYPGFKSGGPQQTIMNIVDILGDEYNFYILTSDKDMSDTKPYKNIVHHKWNTVGKAKVYYHERNGFSFSFLNKIINKFELVYLCGPYYDFAYKTLILNRMGKIKAKVVLAPMGSFGEGAIRNKAFKKNIFWNIERFLGLFNNITWSLTSTLELKEMTKVIGKQRHYVIAQDLPKRFIDYRKKRSYSKDKGTIRIIFLSRFCPKKNLSKAIQLVVQLKCNVLFDLYGTIEDENYWTECKILLENAPDNIHWQYKGTVDPERVIDVFSHYDCFLFPTKNENFGHVIYESLMGGCIPIISDTTPWCNFVEKNCGYIVSLNNENGFIDALERISVMEISEFREVSMNAMIYANNFFRESVRKTGYHAAFEY